jgi:hypothetical protein
MSDRRRTSRLDTAYASTSPRWTCLTGTGAMTNVEYIPYHICSSKTVTHKIYRDAERPSHLSLPIIPEPTGHRPA